MDAKFIFLSFVIQVVTVSSQGVYVGDRVGDVVPGDGRILGGGIVDKVPGDGRILDGGFVDRFPGDGRILDGGFVDKFPGGPGGPGDGRIVDALDRVGDRMLRDGGIVDLAGDVILGDRGIVDTVGERILGGRNDGRFKFLSTIRKVKKGVIDSVRGNVRRVGLGRILGGLAQNVGGLAKTVGDRLLDDRSRKILRDGGRQIMRSVVDAIRPRLRRAVPKNFASVNPLRLTVATSQGNTYSWTRDFGLSNSVEEAAFSSEDKKVVVVLSFDSNLLTQNRTPAATMYDFSRPIGVVAIKPMRRGPCYLMDTSWTYQEVIDELGIRNGSSVSTSMVISLDGTGSPMPQDERRALLAQTPSLRRQCRGRGIVKTKPLGFAPMDFEGNTSDLKIFTLDSEVHIVTRARRSQGAFANFSRWFQGLTQGRFFGRGQSQGQGRGRDQGKTSGGGQTQGSS